MAELYDIDTVTSILKRHGFSFSKALGQNFLTDGTVCPEMADASGIDSSSGVIEIGAGIGVLTKELAKRAGKVVSFEIDTRLLPVLAETLSDYRNTRILNADVLKTDLAAVIDEEFPGMEVSVCANLPYYITSPVIMYLLENKLRLKTITVMVQKEAADRLTAKVGSRESGAVTAAVNYYAEAQKLFDVARTSFMPPPKVDSSVILLTVRDKPPVQPQNEKFFFALIRAAFAQRRKTALNSIGSGLGVEKNAVAAALAEIGLPSTARAETFTMEQFAALSDILCKG